MGSRRSRKAGNQGSPLPLLNVAGKKPKWAGFRAKDGLSQPYPLPIYGDTTIHIKVVEKIRSLAESLGLHVIGVDHSPILGAKGNVEFLIALKKGRLPSASLLVGHYS